MPTRRRDAHAPSLALALAAALAAGATARAQAPAPRPDTTPTPAAGLPPAVAVPPVTAAPTPALLPAPAPAQVPTAASAPAPATAEPPAAPAAAEAPAATPADTAGVVREPSQADVRVGPGPGPGALPRPMVPDVARRSGLVTRFVPIRSTLPGDPKRDDWYDTRFGDAPNVRKHPNFYTNGGLYGLPWRSTCSRSIYPFFYGAPGQDTLGENCRPVRTFWRPLSAIVHPYKPVGMYYDQGSYVPVYDLDPVVPGPGPMIWPFFRRITSAGG